jgi:hypothetical protein
MKPLQYISDYTGKHTAVVIPISEWEKIVRKYSDLKLLEGDSPGVDVIHGVSTMGDFAGTLSPETADALLTYVEQSRGEWDKGF